MTASAERPDRHVSRRDGYTLIELVVSLAVASILFGAATSVVVLASRAMPAGAATRNDGSPLFRLNDEVRYAIRITDATPTGIGFTVADRDGDGNPEHIEYTWDSEARTLLRSYNRGTATTISTNVGAFALEYGTTTKTSWFDDLELTPGSEVVVSEHPRPPTGAERGQHSLEPGSPVGQVFTPNLPGNAVSWELTRIILRARQRDRDARTLLEVLHVDDGLHPTGAPIGSVTIDGSQLFPVVTEHHVLFNGVDGLDPAAPLCFVLSSLQDRTRFQFGTDGSDWLTWENDAWALENDRVFVHEVWGIPSTPQQHRYVARDRLERITASMTFQGTPLVGSAVLVNRPAFIERDWELTFDEAPTTIDLDADGVDDWIEDSGGTIDQGDVQGTLWQPFSDSTLSTHPPVSFDRPVTASVRAMVTQEGWFPDGSAFEIDVETPDGAARLGFQMTLNVGGRQAVDVFCLDTSGSRQWLTSIDGLTLGLHDVAMTIIPEQRLVSVRVDELDLGSFEFVTSNIQSLGSARVIREDRDIVFERVRVSMGGVTGTCPLASGMSGENRPPIARAVRSSGRTSVGGVVTFNGAYSSDPDGDVLELAWRTPDGQVAIGAGANVLFETPAWNGVVLRARDPSGAADVRTVWVYVEE